MKILVWNCRGLGSSRAVRSLLDVQRQVRPDVFFLSETHLSKAKAEKVKRRVGFDHMLIHESDGRSGGLLLFWNNDVKIQSCGISENFIDVLVDDGGQG